MKDCFDRVMMDLLTSSSDETDHELVENVRRRKVYRPRINFDFDAMFRSRDFRARFRLSHTDVERIIQDIGHRLQHETDRNMALTPHQQLLLAFRYLAGAGFMLTVGDSHGPAKSTVSRSVHAVVDAINDFYFNDIVKWPENIEEVVAGFYKIARFPSCVGAIDGCQILIKRPSHDEHQYVNGRSNKHSINTMMVSGPNYYVYYLSAKRPGSVSDQRVLRMSTLTTRFDDHQWRPIPNALILGDSGYKLREWLVTPILRNNLTDAEERYNRRLKRTRVRVECTFGILKKRFACLQKLRLAPGFAADVIKTCVILHNIALRDDPVTDEEIEEIMQEIEERQRNVHDDIEVRNDGASDQAGLRRQVELVAFFSG